METIKTINGNGQDTVRNLPLISIVGEMNEGGLKHIKENTGLNFVKATWENYEAQPETSAQIVALFLTYNFKTQYHDNATNHNTLFLKGDHHIGFLVESICLDCVKHNHIHVGELKQGDRLSC